MTRLTVTADPLMRPVKAYFASYGQQSTEVRAEGICVAATEHPTLLIETKDGDQISWVADLCKVDGEVLTARELAEVREGYPTLVTINVEDREQVRRLVALFLGIGHPFEVRIDDMQQALREFADPKPPVCTEEPMDLAARIVDRDGDIWARSGKRWGCLTTQSAPQDWQDLINVCGPLHEVTP